MARYLDLKADLTFKKVFGEHPNLVAGLLNQLLSLPDGEEIADVEYMSPHVAFSSMSCGIGSAAGVALGIDRFVTKLASSGEISQVRMCLLEIVNPIGHLESMEY